MDLKFNERIYLFLDETGNVKLKEKYKLFSDRYFGLIGIVISATELNKLNAEFDKYKMKNFNTLNVVFHRSGKTYMNGSILIKKLDNKNIKELSNILNDINFYCLGFIVDKDFERKNNISKLNQNKNEIYNYCYEKAYKLFTDNLIYKNTGSIYIEARRRKEVKILEKKHHDLLNNKFTYERYRLNRANLLYDKNLKQKYKTQNVNGLQLADFIAKEIVMKKIEKKGLPKLQNPFSTNKSVSELVKNKIQIVGVSLCYDETIKKILKDC